MNDERFIKIEFALVGMLFAVCVGALWSVLVGEDYQLIAVALAGRLAFHMESIIYRAYFQKSAAYLQQRVKPAKEQSDEQPDEPT